MYAIHKELEREIARAQIRTPKLSRELIAKWLYSFKGYDKNDPEFASRVFDDKVQYFSQKEKRCKK